MFKSDEIKHYVIKKSVTSKYIRRTKIILKSYLNSRNTITAINSCVLSIIRYSAWVRCWRGVEMKALGRRT